MRELGGGTGSYGFHWRVVAGRKAALAGSRLMRAADPRVAEVLERLPGPPADRPSIDPGCPPPAPATTPSRR